jgi:hypothetical protein
MDTRVPEDGEGLSDFLQACRRVLTAGVLARDRGAVLSLDPAQWPRGADSLHDPERAPRPARGAEREMIEFGHDLQLGLAEALERSLASPGPEGVAAGLLELLLDCARARFVYEETAMRLRGDPDRFEHDRSHRRILDRLAAAKGLVRAGRADAARALVIRFRGDLAEHAARGAGVRQPADEVPG